MTRGRWVLVAGAMALAGCTSVETDCRTGVEQMKQRTQSLVGMNQPDDINRAIEQVSAAETMLATGNFKGCVASLENARVFLRKAQGNNQQ